MTMAAWDPRFIDALARKHHAIIFDNRGVGTSTGSVADLTIELMAQDTEQAIAELANGRADVLGLSMGGYIAQRLTIDDPQRVRRLVLAGTDCGGSDAIQARPWAQAIIDHPDEQRLNVLFPPSRIGAGTAWDEAAGAAYAANDFQPDNAFAIGEETVAA